jgi:hypothetical protein
LYLAGVTLYCLTYGIQNFFPNSDWSTSVFGFAASAYTNIFWMIGLGLLGEKFYFKQRLRYRPIFYIIPAVVFVMVHTTHAVVYHQRGIYTNTATCSDAFLEETAFTYIIWVRSLTDNC